MERNTYSKSIQRIIEELQQRCFDVKKKGNVYYCNRPNALEIKFTAGFSEESHLFQVNGKPCHSVGKALLLAGV